jgi:hypothetical protein
MRALAHFVGVKAQEGRRFPRSAMRQVISEVENIHVCPWFVVRWPRGSPEWREFPDKVRAIVAARQIVEPVIVNVETVEDREFHGGWRLE